MTRRTIICKCSDLMPLYDRSISSGRALEGRDGSHPYSATCQQGYKSSMVQDLANDSNQQNKQVWKKNIGRVETAVLGTTRGKMA